MGRRLALIGAALATAGVALIAALAVAPPALADPTPDYAGWVACPADPGAIAPSITNDAAIEVHALRREQAQACAAQWFVLEVINENAEETRVRVAGGGVSLDETANDSMTLSWVGVWFLGGVALVGLFAPSFFSVWRFWRD